MHVYPLKRPGQVGCTFCHQDTARDRLHRHGAVDAEIGCTACHDPHASEHRSLLRAPVATLCSTCHPPDRHVHPHGPYGRGECTACHSPHGSDFSGLLRGGEGDAHCYMCHEAIEVAMTEAPMVHPPAKEGCLNCHAQTHGTNHPSGVTQLR